MVNPSKRYNKKKYNRRYGKKKNPYTIARYVVNKTLNKRIEKKWYDLSINHAATTAGALYDITSSIQQGTANGQRVGDKIKAISAFMRVTVDGQDSPGNLTRVMIVQGKKVLALSDMPSIHGAINSDKMKILYDRLTFQEPATGTAGNKYCSILENEIFLRSTIDFQSNTGTLGDTVNGIYLYTVSDSLAPTHPGVAGFIRIKYRDA